MAVPLAPQLSSQAQALYGQQLGPEAMEYLDALFGAVSKAWDAWSKSIKWGTLLASGAGVGAWSGVATGGVMTGDPFNMESFSFKGNSPQQVKFSAGLADALKQKITLFPPTFKFTTVQLVGTSGATPIAPGPVSASCIPAPMMTAGAGQNPTGIADLWKAALTPPDFKLDDPNAKSGDLITAIAGAIEQSFQTVWLTTTMVSGNTITAAGTPGGVVAGFPTSLDGKLV